METLKSTEVIEWAKGFLASSEAELTRDEVKEQVKYADLIQNPMDKAMLTRLLDESSQIRNNKRLAIRLKELMEQYGVPSFFSPFDRFLFKIYGHTYKTIYPIAIPIFKYRLHKDTAKVIIDEQPSKLNHHLNKRKAQNIGQNINLLGEVVLGDLEAEKRFHHYLEGLEDPRINYISIKITGIYAQINPLNHVQSKKDLIDRLTAIYQKAIDFPYVEADGSKRAKFVNLDMEEYKDIHLTLEVFMETLSKPQFHKYKAGIVIQAYLPDSWDLQTKLLEFARARVEQGGSPIKIRLVKGANLQMESVISSLKGWEIPVFGSKVEVDANYLKILDRGLLPENIAAANLGVASHNFFTIGYAALLSQKYGVEEMVTFEMLEGMANHLPRVLRRMEKNIILYTPVVGNESFLNAVSYLVRRLDENTGKDNFLRYSFNLKLDSKAWNFLKEQFDLAFDMKDKISNEPLRTQDRNVRLEFKLPESTFQNEPDTDFDLPANKKWAEGIRNKWKNSLDGGKFLKIPVQVGEDQIWSEKTKEYRDRSQNDDVKVCELSLSSDEMVENMIQVAIKDDSGWRKTSLSKRKEILHRTAVNLSNKRGDLIGCMSAITGKTFLEGDVEVSEAIDFCRFYPLSMENFESLGTLKMMPKGVILVIPPWNFPLAIPVGGVAAALTGGNTVILKPATVAYPIAWEFAQCFWDAGVPKDALQLICADNRESLKKLTSHRSIKHIILTGGTETALDLLKINPTCPLSAETGGKNAIIVSASGDRDHAVQNIVTSAFSNAGQKCSACSLLILDKDIYHDEEFKAKLRDAVNSLHTGSAWDPSNLVGPMITSNNDKLLHAIHHMEDGESWLVPPTFVDDKRYMLQPCVKWGVKPGSYTFSTELFGPLLAVVCMEDLEEGIELANSSEYGLTAGLQSLDEKEQEIWKSRIEAGNLYINRGITGAIVRRQPFGGMKQSAFGGGVKAGSPNYVSCFVDYHESGIGQADQWPEVSELSYLSDLLTGTDKQHFLRAANSFLKNWNEEFSQERDVSNLLGESNVFRYLRVHKMIFRIKKGDSLSNVAMVLAAAHICKTRLDISIAGDNKLTALISQLEERYLILKQNEDQFMSVMNDYDRVRLCSDTDTLELSEHAARTGLYLAMIPPVAEGRVELLHYLKEQSVTTEYHRYGNIVTKPN